MIDNIEINCHSSIKISNEKIIYVDPFKIEKELHDADIIFITHEHWDHYSKEDIDKVRKENTVIVVPNSMQDMMLESGFQKEKILVVEPNNKYKICNIKFETVPSYNVNKSFHPKENKWVGYVIEIEDVRYYIAGDTDITEENKKVECDVALVPVGGTYTMTVNEAAELVNIINPKIAVPTHYGEIVGSKDDGKEFIKLLKPEIEGKILIKQ